MRHKLIEIDDQIEAIIKYKRENPFEWKCLEHKYNMSWIYHENILDGFALTPEEIQDAVSSDITKDISLVSIYRRIRNYNQCISFIRQQASKKQVKINSELICNIHRILVNGSEIEAGVFRKNSPVHRAYYQNICAPGKITSLLEDLIVSTNAHLQKPNGHILEILAKLQFDFMHIYPFSSWSGAVSRFLSNLILMKMRFVPLVIHCQDRQKYYRALTTNPQSVLQVLIETTENNIANYHHHFVRDCAPRMLAHSG